MPDMNAPKKLNQKEIPLEDLINLWREKGLDEASKYFDLFTKRKIKVIPKDSQEDTEHDITTLTPEQIKRTFIWLKKRGYTDQEAHDLLKEKFADDLIRHIVKSKTDKVDKPEQVFDITVLTPEEIDWAINMMKSKGWSEQECNSIIKQKYAEILLYRFLADRIRNKEKEENIQIPKQIELVMNHIKTNGWSDEMAHITINYLYENNKLKSN
jgi:DNA-binding transcriptional regulator YhcF (GntR family)